MPVSCYTASLVLAVYAASAGYLKSWFLFTLQFAKQFLERGNKVVATVRRREAAKDLEALGDGVTVSTVSLQRERPLMITNGCCTLGNSVTVWVTLKRHNLGGSPMWTCADEYRAEMHSSRSNVMAHPEEDLHCQTALLANILGSWLQRLLDLQKQRVSKKRAPLGQHL